ncbi:MAG: (2Fe-2S)-binding protein [Chloroflexota bacterium]
MVEGLRIQTGIDRGDSFEIKFNGQNITAYHGETIATVLLGSGMKMLHHSTLSGEPRGVFCGMGLCYDCLVTLNGEPNIRACRTYAQPGDVVEGQV